MAAITTMTLTSVSSTKVHLGSKSGSNVCFGTPKIRWGGRSCASAPSVGIKGACGQKFGFRIGFPVTDLFTLKSLGVGQDPGVPHEVFIFKNNNYDDNNADDDDDDDADDDDDDDGDGD
eukprot:8143798-Karenia_brevis.AAC.1